MVDRPQESGFTIIGSLIVLEAWIVGRDTLRELDCSLASSDQVFDEVIEQKCRHFRPQFLIIIES